MLVDHSTTSTIASLSVEDLGGWGATYTIFSATTESAAIESGYDSSNLSHKIMLYAETLAGPIGVVIRYLHAFEASIDLFQEGVESEDMKLEVMKNLTVVREERRRVKELCNGINQQIAHGVKGIGDVSFFGKKVPRVHK
jgi:hypothetical protein